LDHSGAVVDSQQQQAAANDQIAAVATAGDGATACGTGGKKMNKYMKWLSRLWLERRQEVKPLEVSDRIKLLATVAEHDAAMRVIQDVLTEAVTAEFRVVIGPETNENKLRAAERMRTAWVLLVSLDEEWQQAKAWKRKQEENQ
jgi:hypothetical protein